MSTVHIAKFVEALNVSHSELLDTKAKANGGGRIAVLEAAAHKLCFQIATLPDGVPDEIVEAYCEVRIALKKGRRRPLVRS